MIIRKTLCWNNYRWICDNSKSFTLNFNRRGASCGCPDSGRYPEYG